MKTYYEVLGVRRNATTADISTAYRSLVAKYHPDRYEGNALQELAEEKLKALNEAHEVLSKPNLRREYDAALDGRGPPMPTQSDRAPAHQPPPMALIVARWIVLGLMMLLVLRVFRDPRLFGIVLAGWVAWRIVRWRRG